MFRFPSFGEAVDAETGDQDGQMFLVVSSGRTELPDEGTSWSERISFLIKIMSVGVHSIVLSVVLCSPLISCSLMRDYKFRSRAPAFEDIASCKSGLSNLTPRV